MLSLCQRAGKIASGELTCEKALQNGSAFLVIVAQDASLNTKEKFKNKAFYYQTDIFELSTREELGAAIGKDFRAVLAICDENFAMKIKECIDTKS